jgi:hypothetical protein
MDADHDAQKLEHQEKQNGLAEQAAARDEEIRKAQLASLQQEATAGDQAAKVELDRLNTSREREATETALLAIVNDGKSTDSQRLAANQQLAESRKAALAGNDAALKANETSILEKQAALGDESAQRKLQALEATKANAEAEAKLNAILSDSLATDQQKLEAQQQLSQMKAVTVQQSQQAAGAETQNAGLFLLQQEASLGDKIAQQQLKKIEIEKEYGAQKKKLLDIVNDEKSGDEARAQARKLLAGLDDGQAKAEKQAETGEKKKERNTPALATLEESGRLTGVAARAEQEHNQYEPVVSAQNMTTQAVNDLSKTLIDYFKNQLHPTKKLLT